jgi:hypothetical protein
MKFFEDKAPSDGDSGKKIPGGVAGGLGGGDGLAGGGGRGGGAGQYQV